MITLSDGIKLINGPRGTGLCFDSSTGDTREIDPDGFSLLKLIQHHRSLSVHQICELTGKDQKTIEPLIQNLIKCSILNEDLSYNHPLPDESKREFIHLTRVDKYKFLIGDLAGIKQLSRLFQLTDWSRQGRRFLPLILVVSTIALYSFYFSPVRPLGTTIKQATLYSPSIYEVFFVFVTTNIATVVYKVAVGAGKSYGSTKLYLKLLAGFHPVFETEEDPPYSSRAKSTKSEYFFYVTSTIVARLYILIGSILILTIFYPFLTSLGRHISSYLLTAINLSLVAIGWQLIPSPGTLSVKVMEIYGLLPTNLLGQSMRLTLKSSLRISPHTSGHNTINRYRLFFLFSVILVILKLAFLSLYVLPEMSLGIPNILGEWTQQLVLLGLFILSVRFFLYSFTPKPAKSLLPGGTGTPEAFSNKENQLPLRGNTLFESDRIKFAKYFKNKAFLITLLIILLFPFASSVAGSATVEENMSLLIKSNEKEPSYVSSVYAEGPSSIVIRRGAPILALDSDSLRLAQSTSQDSIESLKAQRSLLEIEKKALENGGSTYEESRNRSEDVLINASDIASSIEQLKSLSRQLLLSEDQAKRYKGLVASGAVSELQYQDKKKEIEDILVKKLQTINQIETARLSLTKAKRDKNIDQNLKIQEDMKSTIDQIKKTDASLRQEKSNLASLNRRLSMLTIRAPFDCVIETDTSLLEGKTIRFGDEIVSVKAVPTEKINVQIPEYNRSDVSTGDNVEIRLYSRVASKVSGYLSGVVEKISPVSTTDIDQEKLNVIVKIDQSLHNSMIGATGTAKIRTGFTCLLFNLLKPVARFVEVDLWQYLP